MKRNTKKHMTTQEQYLTTFIKETSITARSGKTVYICKEHHDRITKILQVIGKNEVSLFSYIHNVMEQHFADFKGEISELYRKSLPDDIF